MAKEWKQNNDGKIRKKKTITIQKEMKFVQKSTLVLIQHFCY